MMRWLKPFAIAAALVAAISLSPTRAQDRPVFTEIFSVRPVTLEKPAAFAALDGQERQSAETLLIAVVVDDIVPFLPTGSKIPAVAVNGVFAEILYGPYADGQMMLLAPVGETGPGATLELSYFADGETARALAGAPKDQREAIDALIQRAPRLRASVQLGQPVRAADLPSLRVDILRGAGRIGR